MAAALEDRPQHLRDTREGVSGVVADEGEDHRFINTRTGGSLLRQPRMPWAWRPRMGWHSPKRESRNIERSMPGGSPVMIAASTSPSAGLSLNPWPENPAAM